MQCLQQRLRKGFICTLHKLYKRDWLTAGFLKVKSTSCGRGPCSELTPNGVSGFTRLCRSASSPSQHSFCTLLRRKYLGRRFILSTKFVFKNMEHGLIWTAIRLNMPKIDITNLIFAKMNLITLPIMPIIGVIRFHRTQPFPFFPLPDGITFPLKVKIFL